MLRASKVPTEGFCIRVEGDAGFEGWGGGQTSFQSPDILSAEGREGGGIQRGCLGCGYGRGGVVGGYGNVKVE